MRWTTILVVAAVSAGCEKTQECERLEAMLERTERIAADARKKAGAHDRLVDKVEKTKKDAQAFLDGLGLDDAEEKTKKILDDRVAAIAGATVKRNVRPPDPASSSMRQEQTYWTVVFSAKTPARAVELMNQLAASPPLFMIKRLNRDSQNPTRWQLELVRALVDRVPLDPKVLPLEALPDPAGVQSEFGFCGAGGLRSKLAALKTEVDALKEKAEQLTVLLPIRASWQGILSRAKKLNEAEEESRKLIELFTTAALEAKVPLVGIGVLDPHVILEVKGGAAEARKLEAQLASRASEIGRDRSEKGMIRMQIANTKLRGEARQRRGRGDWKRTDGDGHRHGAH